VTKTHIILKVLNRVGQQEGLAATHLVFEVIRTGDQKVWFAGL